ncbi:unnamed protein product [Calicophoron daubneyi]|uniref:Uncharacterized protein n=1 Tax=Calicophoron daubneyi TaxID=300641 RepID=A0AAV2TFR8_CALDB
MMILNFSLKRESVQAEVEDEALVVVGVKDVDAARDGGTAEAWVAANKVGLDEVQDAAVETIWIANEQPLWPIPDHLHVLACLLSIAHPKPCQCPNRHHILLSPETAEYDGDSDTDKVLDEQLTAGRQEHEGDGELAITAARSRSRWFPPQRPGPRPIPPYWPPPRPQPFPHPWPRPRPLPLPQPMPRPRPLPAPIRV